MVGWAFAIGMLLTYTFSGKTEFIIASGLFAISGGLAMLGTSINMAISDKKKGESNGNLN